MVMPREQKEREAGGKKWTANGRAGTGKVAGIPLCFRTYRRLTMFCALLTKIHIVEYKRFNVMVQSAKKWGPKNEGASRYVYEK